MTFSFVENFTNSNKYLFAFKNHFEIISDLKNLNFETLQNAKLEHFSFAFDDLVFCGRFFSRMWKLVNFSEFENIEMKFTICLWKQIQIDLIMNGKFEISGETSQLYT